MVARIAAAGDLLFAGGLPAVTFEKVAGRAGASKMTLYKWWPSPGALALEAYFAAVQDTGKPRRTTARGGTVRSVVLPCRKPDKSHSGAQ